MNQILEFSKNKEDKLVNSHLQYKNTKIHRIYEFQFVFFSSIAIIFLIVFLFRILKNSENEKLSKQLMKNYKVSTLYSENSDYSAKFLENNTLNNSNSPFVIGMIKIDKIKLNYPILYESNKEYLTVSLCRFAGPMPNEVRQSLYCRA